MKNKNKNAVDASNAKKQRKRFNLIDFLILLFVLAFVFVVINVFSPTSFFKKIRYDAEKTLTYAVEFRAVDKEFIDKILENDKVIDSVSKHSLGKVRAVEKYEYTTLEYDSVNGNAVYAAHADKYNVVVTITATATYRAGEGYSVNDCRIAVGEKLALRFPNYSGEGYCINLSFAE